MSDSILQPFKFRTRTIAIDWSTLSSIDVEKTKQEVDVPVLQSILDTITFSKIDEFNCSPFHYKFMSLSQLLVEYLLHVQLHQDKLLTARTEKLKVQDKKLASLKAKLLSYRKDEKVTQRDLERTRTMVQTCQDVLRRNGINPSQPFIQSDDSKMNVVTARMPTCDICKKVFVSAEFLEKHKVRRHENITPYLEKSTNDFSKVSTIVLVECGTQTEEMKNEAPEEVKTEVIREGFQNERDKEKDLLVLEGAKRLAELVQKKKAEKDLMIAGNAYKQSDIMEKREAIRRRLRINKFLNKFSIMLPRIEQRIAIKRWFKILAKKDGSTQTSIESSIASPQLIKPKPIAKLNYEDLLLAMNRKIELEIESKLEDFTNSGWMENDATADELETARLKVNRDIENPMLQEISQNVQPLDKVFSKEEMDEIWKIKREIDPDCDITLGNDNQQLRIQENRAFPLANSNQDILSTEKVSNLQNPQSQCQEKQIFSLADSKLLEVMNRNESNVSTNEIPGNMTDEIERNLQISDSVESFLANEIKTKSEFIQSETMASSLKSDDFSTNDIRSYSNLTNTNAEIKDRNDRESANENKMEITSTIKNHQINIFETDENLQVLGKSETVGKLDLSMANQKKRMISTEIPANEIEAKEVDVSSEENLHSDLKSISDSTYKIRLMSKSSNQSYEELKIMSSSNNDVINDFGHFEYSDVKSFSNEENILELPILSNRSELESNSVNQLLAANEHNSQHNSGSVREDDTRVSDIQSVALSDWDADSFDEVEPMKSWENNMALVSDTKSSVKSTLDVEEYDSDWL